MSRDKLPRLFFVFPILGVYRNRVVYYEKKVFKNYCIAPCMHGLTSCFCTPQDVDSFGEGFKEGYFGDDYDEK